MFGWTTVNMADTGIFATTAEVQRKVNVNANSTANTEEFINQFMTEVESLITTDTTFNWSDAFSALDVDTKGILKLAATELAAFMVESSDPEAIGTSTFAISSNAHIHKYQMALIELRKKDTQEFIKNV